MSIASEPQLEAALRASYEALREVAAFQLDPALAARLQDLGERKEFLDEGEHQALLALVDFAQRRTVERLRAEIALKPLETARPELATAVL